MRMCMVLLFMLLIKIRARINKCESHLFEECFCGKQFYKRTSMFVVNCTGQGFTDTEILKKLPEETELLIFTGNHIKTIPGNIFGVDTYLSMLRIIDMSNNGITEIHEKAFYHVTTVETLILNQNNISVLRPVQSAQSNLHDIFVSSNLTKEEAGESKHFGDNNVFCDLKNLRQLYLANNNIPNLSFNITCLHQLVYLNLEGNKITNFSDDDLKNFDQLTVPFHPENLVIDINENPFRCDSTITNLYNWLHKTKILVRYLESLECYQSQHGKKYIMDLKNINEKQHTKMSHILLVILVILVVILLTLLAVYIYLKNETVKKRLLSVLRGKVQYTTIESQE